MPSICDILIASNVLQVTLLVACKLNFFSKDNVQGLGLGHKKIDDDKEESMVEKHSKMPMKLPEPFSGNVPQ